jgi:uncharacterized protein YggT (Ycf19 family)
MVILESFNNLNPFISFLVRNNITVQVIHFLCIFLLNAISYFSTFIKFYRLICYAKFVCDWLPMINPYIWPFSFVQVLTTPYFSFWEKILPSIKLEKSSFGISGFIAIEALNSLTFICVRSGSALLAILEETEKALNNPL